MRVAPKIALTEADRTTLIAWKQDAQARPRRAQRARIVLLAAEGKTNLEIATILGLDRRSVGRWRTRVAQQGIAILANPTRRRSSVNPLRDHLTKLILETTLTTLPPAGTRWTTRSLAATLGVSRCRVDRVWRANGIRQKAATSRRPSGASRASVALGSSSRL